MKRLLKKICSVAKNLSMPPIILGSRCISRVRYYKTLKRIMKYPPTRKIKVLFIVSSASKWKCQQLYLKMVVTDRFDPYIALTANKDDLKLHAESIKEKLEKDEQFFKKLGDRCIYAYDINKQEAIPFDKLEADIVFYQEPGFLMDEHSVAKTSRKALCCYVQYAIDLIGKHIWIHNIPWFHQKMFAWFADNNGHKEFVNEVCPWWKRSGAVVATGNPILDEYEALGSSGCLDDLINDGYVIYAPHFSIPVDGYPRVLTLSSFLDNGREILKYAKEHPQFNWLFKPHPHLRDELVSRGVWTKEEVDDYYSEWERLGKGWYGGDYIRLFKASRALITDCGSFMAEYPITGKPLIHLISSKLDFPIREQYKEMVASFYSVHNNEELLGVFNMILEKEEDPKRNERIKAVKKTGLMNPDASGRIVRYLSDCLSV